MPVPAGELEREYRISKHHELLRNNRRIRKLDPWNEHVRQRKAEEEEFPAERFGNRAYGAQWKDTGSEEVVPGKARI